LNENPVKEELLKHVVLAKAYNTQHHLFKSLFHGNLDKLCATGWKVRYNLKIFTDILQLLSDLKIMTRSRSRQGSQKEPTLIIIQNWNMTFSISGMLHLQCGRGWSGFICQLYTSNGPWNESLNLPDPPKCRKDSGASMLETIRS
jgi:hypothetical protein